MYRVQTLTTNAEKNLAYALLYSSYVEDVGWIPDQNNPSGLVIEKDSKGNAYLKDDFSDLSTLIGLFDENELVGCVRVILPSNQPLEFQRYTSVMDNSIPKESIEINRLALISRLQNTKAAIYLVRGIAEFCLTLRPSKVYAVLSQKEPIALLEGLGFTHETSETFKYSQKDAFDSRILGLDCSQNTKAFERIIEACDHLL